MGKWVCFSCKQEKGIFATHYDYNDLLIGQCPPRFGHDDRLCKNCYNKIKGSSGKAKKINKYYAVALILIPVGVLFLILGTSFSVELIVFGGLLSFIGLMAYFVSGDPQNKRKKKIAVMATVGAIGVLIVPSLAYHEVYSKFYPEEYATQREERELEKLEERLAQEREERITELQKQKTAQIEKMQELPASCDGVYSTETWLYPTGEQCIIEIMSRVYVWCLSEKDGNKIAADACVDEFTRRLVQLCKDPVFGISSEVCMMSTMKELYPKMIPK